MRTAFITLALTLFTTAARADEPAPKQTAAVQPADDTVRIDAFAKKRLKKPLLVHANLGILAASYSGPASSMPNKLTTVADRQTVLQMFGVGRFIRPNLRVTLSMQLAEAAGGAPAGSPTLTNVGIVPWLGYHPARNGFLGAGPIIAPRIYGKNQLDLGLFTTAGVVFPIGHGFSAGAAVQFPVMFVVKTTVSAAPATFLAYRF